MVSWHGQVSQVVKKIAERLQTLQYPSTRQYVSRHHGLQDRRFGPRPVETIFPQLFADLGLRWCVRRWRRWFVTLVVHISEEGVVIICVEGTGKTLEERLREISRAMVGLGESDFVF